MIYGFFILLISYLQVYFTHFLFDNSWARKFYFPLAEYDAFFLAAEGVYVQAITAVERKLRDPRVAYIVEAQDRPSSGGPEPVILHGFELDPAAEELPENAVNAVILESDEDSLAKSRTCSYFLSETRDTASFNSVEEVVCLSIDINFTNHLEFDDELFMNIYWVVFLLRMQVKF